MTHHYANAGFKLSHWV